MNKNKAKMPTKTITLSQLPAILKKMERNGERPRTPKPSKNNPFGYTNALKKEYKVFEKNLNSFMRKHKGKYVLIKGNEVEGFYSEQLKAIRTGVTKYGETGSFLVKLVTRKTPEPIFMPSLIFGPRYI